MKKVDIAYNEIKKEIINLTIAPGDPISDKDLGLKLGIGRTPVREALNKLEKDNLVKIFPKRGTFVTNLYISEVADIYSVRGLLEPYAGRLATKNIDLTELEYFYNHWIDDNYNKKIDLDEHMKIDNQFHRLIVVNCNNKYLISMLMNFFDHVHRIRNFTKEYIFTRSDKSRIEHLKIIEMIKERDECAVESCLKEHILNVLKSLENYYMTVNKL